MDSILEKETFNICYAIYDKTGNFSKIAGTAIVSVFENTTSQVSIHLLHDNTLTEENRAKFVRLTRSYGQEISFYNVETLLPDVFASLPGENRFSKAAMYRLLIAKIIPDDIKKIVYLDVDTIATIDIAELWREEIGENGIGAISERTLTYDHMIPKSICQEGFVSVDRYFNSGVLLIDMEKFKTHPNLLFDGLELLKSHPEWNCYDQDILNYYFAENYRQLPIHYDIFTEAERVVGINYLKRGIYHYAGMAVNVFKGEDIFNRLWFHYFLKSPWFDENMLLKIFALAPQAHDSCRVHLCQILNSMVGRRRIFMGYAASEASIRSIFVFAEHDSYVTIDESYDEPISFLIKELKNLMPNEIGVLCLSNYSLIRQNLIENGLTEGAHFVNGAAFLPSVSGGESIDGQDIIHRL
ncbi:MAG: hypothetical protein IKN43_09920 [Selenomonadaceae bacterium]|nr:hypothetical protein [Selenomonadaceae bacterium]